MIRTKTRRKFVILLIMLVILFALVIINNYSFSLVNIRLVCNLFVITGVLLLMFFANDFDDFSVFESRQNKYYNVIDYYSTFIFALMCLQVLYAFIIFPTVQYSSMIPTLYEGDRIAVVMSKKLERFDVVVFEVDVDILDKAPLEEDHNLWVKRVIGLPGDKVQYIDGKLYINDQFVNEPFLYDEDGNPYQGTYKTSLPANLNGIVIPEGYYLCLGDNRSVSFDSRNVGLIPKSLIIGKGKYIIYSLFDWKKIGG